MTVNLKRFTAFSFGHDDPAPEVWINPAAVVCVRPRTVTRGHAEVTEGARIYLHDPYTGAVDVRESLGHTIALLQSGASGICKDCFQQLDESWRQLCDECRGAHHQGVDDDREPIAEGDYRYYETPRLP